MELVILVDESDQETGTMEKMLAHEQGKLHRAFSVLIFNSKGEILLQQRSTSKYHCGGLWTNACCSHPRPGESIIDAANRKLMQEMGIACPLTYSYKFKYRAALDKNMIEHEWDYVLIGYTDQVPSPNPDEVMKWKYERIDWIKSDTINSPDKYTPWFKLIMKHPELQAIGIN